MSASGGESANDVRPDIARSLSYQSVCIGDFKSWHSGDPILTPTMATFFMVLESPLMSSIAGCREESESVDIVVLSRCCW